MPDQADLYAVDVAQSAFDLSVQVENIELVLISSNPDIKPSIFCTAVVRPSSKGHSSQFRLLPPQFMSGPLTEEELSPLVDPVVVVPGALAVLMLTACGAPSLPTPGH